MKIILISPYRDITAFGIRTLSACLKKDGHSVKIIFLRNEPFDRYKDELLEKISELCKGSDLIGISLMTNLFENAVQITQKLKQRTCLPILWGGIHPTIRPEESMQYADMVCIGEGEESLVELVKKMESGQDFHHVQGIWSKNNGEIIKNSLRPLVKNLDAIPFPDYQHEDHYIQDIDHIRKLDLDLLKRYICQGPVFGRPTYVTIATRGCVFGCTYCCNNALHKLFPSQKTVRKRSVDNIIGELRLAKEKIDFIENIWFEDDSFFAYTEEEIRDFCEKYKKNNIGLSLEVHGVSPQNFTKKKLSFLVEAGLKIIRVGIQTGSLRTKKLYERTYSNDLISTVAKEINEYKGKLWVQYDIILDNPWESEEDLAETLMLLSTFSPPFTLGFYSLTFYPETELYRKAREEGKITDELKEIYQKDYFISPHTYINKLFFLLNYYSFKGRKISPKTMFLLTNRKSGMLKLRSYLIYFMLKFRLFTLRELFSMLLTLPLTFAIQIYPAHTCALSEGYFSTLGIKK